MILTNRRRLSALCLACLVAGGASAARPCEGAIELVDLRREIVLARLDGPDFALSWRHSVTLTPVLAEYKVLSGRGIVQIAERFVAHGPGMAHDGKGWRIEEGQMVLDLDRDIDRLILRTDPEHENRLHGTTAQIDLTQWPATPLQIRAADCKESE